MAMVGASLECGAEQKNTRSKQAGSAAAAAAGQPAQSGSRVSMCINRGLVNHAYVFLVFGGRPTPDARRRLHASAPPPFQPTEASKLIQESISPTRATMLRSTTFFAAAVAVLTFGSSSSAFAPSQGACVFIFDERECCPPSAVTDIWSRDVRETMLY